MVRFRKIYSTALAKLVKKSFNSFSNVLNAVLSEFGVPSPVKHSHENYLNEGNKPRTERLSGTAHYGFSPINHTHSDLLEKEEPAEDTNALGGISAINFSRSNHYHSDLKAYIRTTPFTFVDSADRLKLEDGSFIAPEVEKAMAEHTHSDLVLQGTTVLTSRAIMKTTTGNSNVYLIPESFSPSIHTHTDYVSKDTAVLTYVPKTYTAYAAKTLEVGGEGRKLVVLSVDPTDSMEGELALDIEYRPIKDMASLDASVAAGVYGTSADMMSSDSFFDIRRDVFGMVTNLRDYIFEASANNRVLSNRELPLEVVSGELQGRAVYSNGLTYIYCWKDTHLTSEELADLLGETGFRENAVAADESFTLRSNVVGKALAGTGDAREVFDGVDYNNVTIIGANTPVNSGTVPLIRLPSEETNIYHYAGISSSETEALTSTVMEQISKDTIKNGPSRYLEVRTSPDIAAAMDEFFRDSVLLAPAPVHIPLNMMFNLWAADTIDGDEMPDSLNLVEYPEDSGKLIIEGEYGSTLTCISLADALETMDDYDFLYMYLGKGSDSNSIASNLAWLSLKAGSAADRTITRMLNTMAKTVNNILSAGYPLLIKFPASGSDPETAIAVWMTDGTQIDYKPPLMDSVVLGSNPEETVLFKRILVRDLKEAYSSEVYKKLKVLGISPLLLDGASDIPMVSRLALGMKEPNPMIISPNSYTTFGTHTLRLPDDYTIVQAQLIPGGRLEDPATFPTDEKELPQTVTQYYPLAGAESKAIKVQIPINHGNMSPRLIGFGGNLITVRSGGQPYTLYLWTEKAEAEV